MSRDGSQVLAITSPVRRGALVLTSGTTPFRDAHAEWRTTLLSGSDLRRRRFEQELDARGIPLVLQHRSVWQQTGPAAPPLFGVVTSPDGHASLGFAASVGGSRTYPGFDIVRVQRFGGTADAAAACAAIRELDRWARVHPVLRLHLEVHSLSTGLRSAIAEECARLGFRPGPMRSYRSTLKIDLRPDPEVIFNRLHATARRHIRAVEKRPVAIRVIDDPALAVRMNELLRESLERTGAGFKPQPFAEMIRFACRNPDLVRIVGLFRTEATGTDPLLAFGVAYHHGDHTEYAQAGCTRRTDLNMPLMYGLAWDLILWSRAKGAWWFDFGGIAGVDNEAGSMAGIADFKRYFGRDVVDVGEEWILEPYPVRAAVARKVGSVARLIANRYRAGERASA